MTAQATPVMDEDRSALRKLKLFSIFFVLVAAAGFVLGFGSDVFAFASAFDGNGQPATTASAVNGLFTVLAASIVVTGTIEVVALLQLRSAFTSLSTVDPVRFSTPAKFTTLMVISLPAFYAAVAIIFAGLESVVSASGTSMPTSSDVFASGGLDYFIVGGLLALVFSVLLLVGAIVGPVLGLWRVGERYDADTIKAGAIVFIIPLVQIASPILILVGVSSVAMNLEATGRAQG